MEPPVAKNGTGGLIDGKTGEDCRFVDPWGHPYIVLIDVNYDGKIANPDARNRDTKIAAGAPRELNMGVIAFSRGEDGIEGTEDDKVSWRQSASKKTRRTLGKNQSESD